MSYVHCALGLDEDVSVSVSYHPRRIRDYGDGIWSMEIPASLHVNIGLLDLFGSPELVLRTLCEALARAREAEASADDGQLMTDLGGVA
jgi:hypothetical protein